MAFTFDPTTGRYRTDDGRFVREDAVRAALDQVIAAQGASMRTVTQALMDGQLALEQWQAQMMQFVKSAHLVGLALANGGWASLDQADFGWVGQRIRTQYAFLAGFADQLASGAQSPNGTALARAELYAHAARATNREAERRAAKERGLGQEKSNLGAADHCGSCLTEAAQGWRPIGTLLPVGSRECMSNCHCWFSYRPAAQRSAA